MFFGHGLDIEQTEPVTFHIVQIAGGDAVELIEYMFLFLGVNADSTVADSDFNEFSLFRRAGLATADVHFRFFGGVFYGIVNQVADDIAEMGTVCGEGKS